MNEWNADTTSAFPCCNGQCVISQCPGKSSNTEIEKRVRIALMKERTLFSQRKLSKKLSY
jgi:hypothetical protein